MTGATPRLGLPYPEADTLITDSAAIVQELAEKIEGAIPEIIAVEPEPSTKSNQVSTHLIADITASGSYTVPDLVGDGSPTLWDIVIISGGYPGVNYGPWTNNYGGVGGAGGHVRIFRGIKMASGSVFPVTIGGQSTGSTFGPLSIPAGSGPSQPEPYGAGAPGGKSTGQPGAEGCTITPTNGAATYWCGGGGSGGQLNGAWDSLLGGPGGNRGGGKGGNGGVADSNSGVTSGEPGTFGGGGGGGGGGATYVRHGGGSPGRVLLFVPIAGDSALRRALPTPVEMYAALDAAGTVLIIVEADQENPYVPGVEHDRLVPFPDEPVDTGRTVLVPIHPEDPESLEMDVPVLAWPEAGWKYINNEWEEPK